MKAPRFFIGSVLLFWGWQVQTLWLAIGLATIIEIGCMIKLKFELHASDFNNFVDVSIVLLAGTSVLALTTDAQNAIWIILKWLPLVFYPVVAAQEFSLAGKIDRRSFFLVARKARKIRADSSRKVDVSYVYSFFCLVSSATANTKGPLFYVVVVLLCGRALWPFRSRRAPVFLWAMCVVAAVGLGYANHRGIRSTSRAISHWIVAYYTNYYAANPFKSYTAMGEVGRLKLSDKIVLRVRIEAYTPGHLYRLHNATYTKFIRSNWFADSGFKPIPPGQDKGFWQINPPGEDTRKMTIYFRPIKTRAVLSLPSGVISIAEMKAGLCEKNSLQAIRIEGGAPLIKAVVQYTGQLSYDTGPREQDLVVPERERPAIEKIAADLLLEDKSKQERLAAVKHYFLTGYAYSLELQGKGNHATPLQNFLYHTRAGHCEFFATATVFLLRQAGIPARYVTGYVAHEYSRMGAHLVVRQRDAHAWAKAYINGRWRVVDNTPPSFVQADSQIIKLSPAADLVAFLGFKLSQLRHETGAKPDRQPSK